MGLSARTFEDFWIVIVPFIAVVSYAVGTIPAALTGVYAAIRVLRAGHYGYGEAALAALASATLVVVAWASFASQRGLPASSDLPGIWAAISAASIISALACRRLLAQRLMQKAITFHLDYRADLQ